MSGLLRSHGGVLLCPEICLRIAEKLLVDDPESMKSLLLTSKTFCILLKTYEKSICTNLFKRGLTFVWVNNDQPKILSSRMPLGSHSVTRYTYAWASEMLTRAQTVNFLIKHELTDMIDHHTQSWPTLDLPKEALCQRIAQFKKLSFFLLYKLADCTTSQTQTMEIRANQAEFLESLTASELASLGVIVEVMGQNYFTMTKNCLDVYSADSRTSRLTPRDWFFAPSTIRSHDASNDNWIRECMCVFEDLVQRFGPHFPYAFLQGGNDRVLQSDCWAQKMLQEGLDNMNAFELGHTMSFASLQSVVWKVFCRSVDCTLQESWNTAKEMVQNEMRGYEIAADDS